MTKTRSTATGLASNCSARQVAPAGGGGGTSCPASGRMKASGDPGAVASATTKLRDNGVEGPFAVVLNEQLYKDLAARTEGGYPMLTHVKRLVDGDIVPAPGLEGGLVLSLRGGDFELSVGQDFSIGYLSHTDSTVRLYLQETFTFLLLTSEAAVALTPAPTA